MGQPGMGMMQGNAGMMQMGQPGMMAGGMMGQPMGGGGMMQPGKSNVFRTMTVEISKFVS